MQNIQVLCKGWKCGWFTGCHNGCVPSFWFYSFQPASQTSLSWISVPPWVYCTIYFYQLPHIPNSFCWQSFLSYQRLCFAGQLEAVYLQKLVWHEVKEGIKKLFFFGNVLDVALIQIEVIKWKKIVNFIKTMVKWHIQQLKNSSFNRKD